MRVALADDSILLREGVACLLTDTGFHVVAQTGTADELLEVIRRTLRRGGGGSAHVPTFVRLVAPAPTEAPGDSGIGTPPLIAEPFGAAQAQAIQSTCLHV